MKRTTFIAAILCLLGAGLSCTHDEPSKSERNDGNNVHEWEDSTLSGDAVMGEKMMFRVGDSLQVIRRPSTRLSTAFDGQNYTLSGDDRITIAMQRGSESEVIKIYKVKDADTGALEYEKDADGNKTEPFYWKSTTETVKLRAWSYGTSEAYTSDPLTTPFTLNTIQTELAVGKDNYRELLYDKQRNYPYAANITLNLYHQLARITVELTNSATSDLSIATNGVTIGGGVLPTSAQFVAPTGDSNVGSWDDLQTNSGTVTARADVANQKYSAVVFPKTYSAGTKIVGVTTTAESPFNSYAYTLPSGGEELEAGKQYSYKVNVRDLVLVSSLTVSDIAAVTYNGSAQTPEPTVTDPVSGKVLTKDTHYTLSYTNNTNAGTATCTVTGKGIYSGTKTKDFTINKAVGTISDLTFTNSIKIGYTTTASVTNTGDGTVVYTSGATNLATVNGSTLTGLNAGSPVITATVTDGANYTYVTKTLTKTLTVTSDVGKVLGANGQFYSTVSAATSAGTTASGIVAYMGLPGSIDESSSTYRYLVIALTDGNANGENLRFHTENSATNCGLGSTGINDALSIINGIATTNSLVNSNGAGLTSYCNGHTHGIARAAREVNTSRPSGASAWFLPSLGQWQLIVQGLATKKAGYPITTPLYQDKDVNDEYKQTNLNSVITDAGGTGFTGTDYWSCTEYYSGVSVYSMYFTKGRYSGLAKTRYEFPFRAVFAY